MTDLFRVYFDPAEIGFDGYPYAWHGSRPAGSSEIGLDGQAWVGAPAIKDLVREQAGHRCVRCGHPYRKGEHAMVEVTDPDGSVRHESWSPCDGNCSHRGPFGLVEPELAWTDVMLAEGYAHGKTAQEVRALPRVTERNLVVMAKWRILTVHHLNGVKYDCRWWNLASLCQRCHLTIQSKVYLERPYDREHSEWFKPYAAGWYAYRYLGLELQRAEVEARLDELLDLELRQEALF